MIQNIYKHIQNEETAVSGLVSRCFLCLTDFGDRYGAKIQSPPLRPALMLVKSSASILNAIVTFRSLFIYVHFKSCAAHHMQVIAASFLRVSSVISSFPRSPLCNLLARHLRVCQVHLYFYLNEQYYTIQVFPANLAKHGATCFYVFQCFSALATKITGNPSQHCNRCGAFPPTPMSNAMHLLYLKRKVAQRSVNVSGLEVCGFLLSLLFHLL